MTDLSKDQLSYILSIFKQANHNNKLIFIKGGWNIDLRFPNPTREHGDVDFHYNIDDKAFWAHWHESKQFIPEVQDDFYTVFRNSNGVVSDFEGFTLNGDKIQWKHGGTSFQNDVFEEFKFENKKLFGMKLSVEKYLKEKSRRERQEFREKDIHDLELLGRLLV